MTRNMRRERGLALITAVFVVAIVATVAAFLALGQQIWIRQAQNFTDRAQGDAVARGATAYALMVLRKDAKDDATRSPATDNYDENWAKPIATPVEGGIGAGQITDAQAHFNLNSLVDANNAPSGPDVAVFRRLLDELNLSAGFVEAIIDWIDDNDTVSPGGAEDVDYLTLDPPYRAANQKIVSIEELRLIKGVDAKTFEALAPYLVALPERTTINVNTADATVIGALFNPAPGNLEQVLKARKGAPFTTTNDLLNALGTGVTFAGPAGAAGAGAAAGVTSKYFLLEAQTKFGRVNRGLRALLERNGNNVEVLWQRQLLPIPPKAQQQP